MGRFENIAAESTSPREALAHSIEECEMAYRCIAENRGRENKAMAREAYENTITEVLAPAIENAIQDVTEPRHLMTIAKTVLKKLDKEAGVE